jgi:hypothetical protein
MTISNQTGKDINKEVKRATVSGEPNLRDILELINYGLDNGTFSKQDFAGHGHDLVLPVPAKFGDMLDTESMIELFEK